MKKTLLISLIILMASFVGVNAAPKTLGKCTYQFAGDYKTVTLSLDGITNDSVENATGKISVQLWALNAPYVKLKLNGHLIAGYTLDGLHGGRQYNQLNKSLPASMPAKRGNYHICLTVSEYKESGYVISSFVNMSKVISLGPLAPAKPFTMTTPWSWKPNFEAGTLNIQVKKITNGKNAKTGSLVLAVWAFPTPYKGTPMKGHFLGSVSKAALEKGHAHSDVNNTAKLTKPPAGTYHTALLLSEYDGTKYVIVSYLNAVGTSTFK